MNPPFRQTGSPYLYYILYITPMYNIPCSRMYCAASECPQLIAKSNAVHPALNYLVYFINIRLHTELTASKSVPFAINSLTAFTFPQNAAKCRNVCLPYTLYENSLSIVSIWYTASW